MPSNVADEVGGEAGVGGTAGRRRRDKQEQDGADGVSCVQAVFTASEEFPKRGLELV